MGNEAADRLHGGGRPRRQVLRAGQDRWDAAKILDKIRANLSAKGVKAADTDLEELVDLRTWDESCYEFAHFTDDELVDAIDKVHHTRNGWSREDLLGALRYWRDRRKDVKEVWERGKWDDQLKRPVDAWEYQVSKTMLAEAPWPVLKAP